MILVVVKGGILRGSGIGLGTGCRKSSNETFNFGWISFGWMIRFGRTTMEGDGGLGNGLGTGCNLIFSFK